MPFSGTGSFTLVSGNPVVTGTNISSTVQNNTMSDFANGFTNCVTRDGQSPPTSNLPMGNRRHTGASNATGTGEYLVYGQSLPATTVASLAVTAGATVGTSLTVGTTLDVAGAVTNSSTLHQVGVATFDANPAGKITSGTYTPTATLGANAASATPANFQYLRVGDVVTGSGLVAISPTASATFTSVDLSIPIASAFALLGDCSGVGVYYASGATQTVIRIQANIVSARMTLAFLAPSTSSLNCMVHFTYLVR